MKWNQPVFSLFCFYTTEANIQEKMDYLSTQTAALSGLSGKVGKNAHVHMFLPTFEQYLDLRLKGITLWSNENIRQVHWYKCNSTFRYLKRVVMLIWRDSRWYNIVLLSWHLTWPEKLLLILLMFAVGLMFASQQKRWLFGLCFLVVFGGLWMFCVYVLWSSIGEMKDGSTLKHV